MAAIVCETAKDCEGCGGMRAVIRIARDADNWLEDNPMGWLTQEDKERFVAYTTAKFERAGTAGADDGGPGCRGRSPIRVGAGARLAGLLERCSEQGGPRGE